MMATATSAHIHQGITAPSIFLSCIKSERWLGQRIVLADRRFFERTDIDNLAEISDAI